MAKELAMFFKSLNADIGLRKVVVRIKSFFPRGNANNVLVSLVFSPASGIASVISEYVCLWMIEVIRVCQLYF